ncbi:beta-lactamase family protein [Vibrio sp. Of7-15]|uniref:serine hydrolase domain-containing protein n=1 Tax=Vibrio sp. Of7-15 TaxID=2724879 RepID=UPI001EF33AC7|nr:serine hydrolase domain-containing protein [Vibrio sp. Of7-15]MCG7497320.1 beta-lactamase family protein [Vibrio sp. Of7-15]
MVRNGGYSLKAMKSWQKACLLVSVGVMSFSAAAHRDFDQGKMNQYLEALVKNNKAMLSVSIYEEDKLAYEKSTGYANLSQGLKSTNKTKYKIGSISKTFTSVLVFQLIEQGKLTLTTPLKDFYPDFPNSEKITIGMLLSHRSGIFNFTESPEIESYYTQHQTKQAMLDRLVAFEPVFEPGTSQQYSNSNYLLLSYIIEDVTKKSYGEVLSQNITDPLKLENTIYCPSAHVCGDEAQSYFYQYPQWSPYLLGSSSVSLGAGAIISTSHDVSVFMRALFNGELVSDSSLSSMKGASNETSKGLFKVPFYEKMAYSHNGRIEGFNSNTSHFEQDNVTFTLTSNAINYTYNDILIGIMSIYFGKDFELPDLHVDSKDLPIELSTDQLKKYVGVYSSDSFELDITAFIENNRLFAQATGQAALPLNAYSEQDFKFEPAGIHAVFSTTEEGGIDYTQFMLHQAGTIFFFERK